MVRVFVCVMLGIEPMASTYLLLLSSFFLSVCLSSARLSIIIYYLSIYLAFVYLCISLSTYLSIYLYTIDLVKIFEKGFWAA